MIRKLSTRRPIALQETVYSNRSIPVNLGLSMEQLSLCFKEAIPRYSRNAELKEQACMTIEHLKNVVSASNGDLSGVCHDDLEQIAMVLDDFVCGTANLPPSLIAFVHTCLGLVRQMQKNYNDAIECFLKALWIKSACCAKTPHHIAIASHRLGVAYGLARNYTQAVGTLDKALHAYQESQLISNDHILAVNAKEHRNAYESVRLGKDATDCNNSDDGNVMTIKPLSFRERMLGARIAVE